MRLHQHNNNNKYMIIYSALITALLGLCHIVSDYREKWSLTYLFKPATTLSVIVVFAWLTPDWSSFAQWFLAGLVLSLLGDVLLMLRPAKFIAGLVAFLLAHLAYCSAFGWQLSPSIYAVFYVGVAALLFWRIQGNLNELKIPVLAYIGVILAMVLSAENLTLQTAIPSFWLGALLFMASDAILAVHTFYKADKRLQVGLLALYYAAQWTLMLASLQWLNQSAV